MLYEVITSLLESTTIIRLVKFNFIICIAASQTDPSFLNSYTTIKMLRYWEEKGYITPERVYSGSQLWLQVLYKTHMVERTVGFIRCCPDHS